MTIRAIGMIGAMCFALASCARQDSERRPVSTQVASRVDSKIQTDVIDKYSIDQLLEVLRNRGNKTLHSGEPPELSKIPSSEIADNLIFRQKTVYGSDRRKDYTEIQDPDILKAADSVAGIVPVSRLQAGNGASKIVAPTLGDQFHCCREEAYYSQPVAAVCTAFVVSSDVVATAGHCVKELGSARIVFGFHLTKSNGSVQPEIPDSEIYRPAQVLNTAT